MTAIVAEIFGMDGVIVAAIAVAVLFGAKKIPEMARSMGRAQGEFKKGLREGNDLGSDEPPEPAAPAVPPETEPNAES
ncbi:MAG TPA: twin-arginine translocase TatA/TatE family subunit [Actinomycetota bacterium]|nr:twin-arginine translocase TatA/TatE family subunit [Actinomycetota bacterium]